jgi:SAM-dependent methyltransferase
MNAAHLAFCASDEWRLTVEDLIMPVALTGVDLGSDLLEVRPGPGFTTDGLRTNVAQVTAVEIDPDLARAPADRLAGTNVQVRCGDATPLDLPSNLFDSAVSFTMLHHLGADTAQDLVFAELARVLRPGGLLLAADSVDSEDLRAFHENDTYNPIDSQELAGRLVAAGYDAIEVRTYDRGWLCTAHAA